MARMMRLANGAAWCALMLAASSAVHAQETTSAIRGMVTDGAGAPVAGATVTVLHEPTGTRATMVTDAQGGYAARGLRVGGPYTVTVVSGSQSGEATIDSISVGDIGLASIVLAENVAEVVITGARNASSNYSNVTRFDANDINNTASISRDLKDVVRQDPLVEYDQANRKALIVGGVSSRFNSITIDGVKQNDDFGLNNQGYPTQRSPISINAVQSVVVNTAPFSVVYNDFLGANLNAVTKSGTNEFHGGAFVEYSKFNEFVGFSKGDYDDRTWGGYLGGPIIKDRLFFFGSYEKFDSSTAFPTGVEGSGRPTSITGTTEAMVRSVEDTLASVYSFDYDKTHSILGAADLPVTDEKKQLRIDWNVTDSHRLRLTWQDTYGDQLLEGIRASNSGTRLLPLQSHYYQLSDHMKVYTAQLNSDWNSWISSELTYNHKNVIRGQVPVAGCPQGPDGPGDETCEFGMFSVFITPQLQINAGPDNSRHANELETTTENFSGKLRLESENHSLLLGAEYSKLDVFNLFAQSTEGIYTFRSAGTGTIALADYGAATALENLTRRRPERLQYTNALIDVNGDGAINELDAAAEFSYSTTVFYLEDQIEVNDQLSLLLGVRTDTIQSKEKPTINPYFVQRHGFANDKNLDGLNVWLPRVGFRYAYDDTLSFKGGVGLFSTGGPTVWVSNNYSTNGVVLATVDCNIGTTSGSTSTCSQAQARAVLSSLSPIGSSTISGFDVPASMEALLTPANPGFAAVQRTATVNAIDPGFKMPASWKFSLSGTKFVGDWRFGVDLLHTKVRQGLTWVDYRGGTSPVAFAPDGRPIYRRQNERAAFSGATGNDSGSDIILTNTDQGWSTSLAFSVQRQFDDVFVSFSHTQNRAKDTNPGTSSTAGSSYGNNAVSDPANPALSRSNYEIKYSSKVVGSYAHKWWGDNETVVSVFGERRAGLPYSLVFRPVQASGSTTNAALDYFGDISNARQLLYVPLANDPIVVYEGQLGCTAGCQSATEAQAAMDAYIARAGLEGMRGKIAPRNSMRSEDVVKFDIRLSQELPAYFPNGAKARVYLDIENVGNLLNDEWGVLEQVEFPYMAPIADVRLVNGQYRYSNVKGPVTQTSNSDAPNRSFWGVKVGFAYNF